MQNLVRRLGATAVVAVAFLLAVGVAPAPAQADDVRSSSSGDGVLSGNSLAVDVDAPVTLCGLINGLAVGGIATGAAICGDPGPVTPPSHAISSAEGDGIASGNSAAVDVDAPVSVQCLLNGVGILGVAVGACAAPPPPACGNPCPPPTTCCPPPTTCCPPPTTCPCPTTSSTSTSTSSTSTSSTSSTSSSSTSSSVPPPPPLPPELPDTGGDIGLEVPLGAGLVIGGGLCVWASRRRLARLAPVGR